MSTGAMAQWAVAHPWLTELQGPGGAVAREVAEVAAAVPWKAVLRWVTSIQAPWSPLEDNSSVPLAQVEPWMEEVALTHHPPQLALEGFQLAVLAMAAAEEPAQAAALPEPVVLASVAAGWVAAGRVAHRVAALVRAGPVEVLLGQVWSSPVLLWGRQ